MAFYDHVDELRTRLTRAVTVFFCGFLLAFFTFVEPILTFLRAPLFAVLPPERQHLYFTSLFENFLTHLKVGAYAALFFLAPYFFYELWGFIAPGLHKREQKMVVPFITAATVFFLLGAAFAYFILFPVGFHYFVTYGAPSDIPMLTIDSYYGTCLKLLLLFGLAFELPVLIILLGFLGLVDAPTLRKHRRMSIIGITVIAALFAPPDAVSMLILGIPLVLMYEGAIWVVHWLGMRRKEAALKA
ncbi:MAG TPA: twin-arginine translocase subunit TatC [Bdellovibrionales bacterium]|nr:MAG: twin arginine-targeting protein translocase TatC [Bdellovibrionales bacterium GWB1_52_6]OFZ03497.1 MAG: twin arginine-targeting protein translocase TatC [Bdellovibrionales bacterium GWA1_52_35]OFZ37959.1 MAG: twin arginine-targeting protein translocase TatC [Bdellovibrionales bacterium GWC1_52_8]HAR44434.1 twin-arginine translocase subunit TatC [Bdellovibrionales bacterium]HCM41082.1 twin-arginine translocase subunit TatC [Bdellovibrionales bacterium]